MKMKYNRIACVLIIHVILMGCQVQNNDVVRDCIGLSKHIRHMRWTPDTIAVNTVVGQQTVYEYMKV